MTNFVQVPADSSGKRVNTSVHNDGANDIYTQAMHLADRDNPDVLQKVSAKGEAKVSFDGGSPDFTSFGHTSVSEPNLMAAFKFYETDHSQSFAKLEESGGLVAKFNATYVDHESW